MTISSEVTGTVGVKMKENANCSFSTGGIELVKNSRQVGDSHL